MAVEAALSGDGLAFVLEQQFDYHIAAGRLIPVLRDGCPPFAGYHLYYPRRRQPTHTFAVLVEAPRYRGSTR